MRERAGAGARFAIALLALCSATLLAPGSAFGDTGVQPTPFRDYIRESDFALYRLDRTRSSWAVFADSPDPDSFTCHVAGTFVFRLVKALRGRWPETITKVVKAGSQDYCIWDRVPTGRWILVGDERTADWWGFDAAGRLQDGLGYAGEPDDAPSTLAAWRAAIAALPDTSTVDAAGRDGAPARPASPLLALGAVGGLLAALRRSRARGFRT